MNKQQVLQTIVDRVHSRYPNEGTMKLRTDSTFAFEKIHGNQDKMMRIIRWAVGKGIEVDVFFNQTVDRGDPNWRPQVIKFRLVDWKAYKELLADHINRGQPGAA